MVRRPWEEALRALQSYSNLTQAGTALLKIDRRGGFWEKLLWGVRQTVPELWTTGFWLAMKRVTSFMFLLRG